MIDTTGDMENKTIKDEKKKGLYSGWHWLLWWQISPEELKVQVENYSTLTITKSARGISFLFCIATSILMLSVNVLNIYVLSSTDMVNVGGVIEVILFIILGFLIYKGQRWGMVLAMVFWTVGKLTLVYGVVTKNPGQLASHVVWWCLYMHAFYVSLKVENLRRQTVVGNGIANSEKSL